MPQLDSVYALGEPGSPFYHGMDHSPSWYASLSHLQEMQLGGWTCPNGNRKNLVQTLHQLRQFEIVHSRYPESGAELAEYVIGQSKISLEQVLRQKPVDQLSSLGFAVNPITGKLYESFRGEATEPGAVRFKHLQTYEEVEQAFGERPGATLFLSEGADAAYEITVFSKPGEVLDSHVIVSFTQEPPSDDAIIAEAQAEQRKRGIAR